MKKPKMHICIGIVCFLAVAGGLLLLPVFTGKGTGGNGVHGSGECLQSVYEIDWKLDPASRTLRAYQQVDYVNAETVPLLEVYFHLYPNYFASEDSAPFQESDMKHAYPNGFSAGRITFSSIKADGKQAEYRLQGDAKGILCIRLTAPLEPGSHVSCEFEYTVNLPDCVGRFGAGDDTIQLCNAYPIAAVYDGEGWNLDPYYAVGDPFYSDVSDYTVRIACPPGYIVTGSGSRSKLEAGANGTTYTFACPNVRDIAFVAGKGLRPRSRDAAGVWVTSWYYGDETAGETALTSACDAVEVFSSIFGEYPYPELNVIESDLYYGGMEYPNAVLITDSLYAPGESDTLEYVTVHEVAHQWWYGVVGNDEIDDPWLDESLTEFSTLLFYRERYGETKYREVYAKRVEIGLRLFDDAVSLPKPVGLKTSETDDNLWYTVVVYKQGAHMFRELYEKMGDAAFKSALKAYYQNMFLRNAAPSDLYAALNAATGTDWSGFISAYLQGRPAP